MLHLHPTHAPARLVATIPGVPDSQARALDRRQRLDRQLRSFREADRAAGRPSKALSGPAGPGPA